MASETDTASSGRAAGALLIFTTLVSLVLLAMHPAETATDFVGVLKEEAANQGLNGAVHGGFAALLVVQIVCYAIFSSRLDLHRLASLAGLVFFAAGAMFLCASLVTDGLVIPAIAAKYAAASAVKLDFAKSLFVLCGSAIRFLVPIGLAFQAASIASWGVALLRGPSRLGGIIGLLFGLGVLGALTVTFATMNPMVVMGAMAVRTLWGFVAGWLLMARKI